MHRTIISILVHNAYPAPPQRNHPHTQDQRMAIVSYWMAWMEHNKK